MPLSLTITGINESSKVGDTLTATASAAVTKYEWKLNGTVVATTATYEVPASAKDGDEIKLTVTAEDGETASDVVYVGGLTILKVEPLAQGETYKYVKAYFSSALTSLAPSEIEIRGKKDQKLYSIQTAVLASDGMAADLTLYGNTDSDSTTFLRANTTYVMTLTQNGQSTSLEFELPAYATDKIVTSVDMSKNTITTGVSEKTGETGAAGIFNVAGKYAGNLGSLIGRTVNYQYDTDNNLTAFEVEDAEVVYGAMKFVNDANDLRKAYFKDALTGETYKVNRDSITASKNFTWFYAAEDGDEFEAPEAGKTYNYVKLVLNPDGTVSTANIVETLGKNLFVTSVDGTKVVQDKNNAFDLDGYIIVKDDEYIAPSDIEIGDVVFINTNLKFADVYTNEISGELSNVISGKLDIDETTYNWNGSQYYSADDDEYKTLSTDNNEASQAYLNSLDTETDTTIWIARNKNIVYIDGTVVGQTKYTYETYLVTKTAKSYEESLKNKFNVDVFDGTDTTTVTIDMSQLKFYKGVAGKYEVAEGGDWKTNNQAWDFTGSSDAKYDGVDLKPKDALAQGSLVKFMYNSTGAIVGLSNDEDSENASLAHDGNGSSLNGTDELLTADSPNLKKDSKKLVQDIAVTATGVYKMGDFTNLWIWNEKGAKDDAYSKTVLTDYTNEIVTNNGSKMVGLSYRLDGTKVTDLVVHLTDDSFADAETNTINGVLVDFTMKNKDDDSTQVLNTITIYGTDGVKTKYYADGKLAAITGANRHDYVELTQNKDTELITAATKAADWESTDPSAVLSKTFSNEKLILADADKTEVKTVSGGVILLRYTEEGSVKYKVVDYTDVNVLTGTVYVWYNKTNVSKDGKKVDSDMIVVEQDAETPAVTRDISIAGDPIALLDDGDDYIASTATTTLKATVSNLGTGVTVTSYKWYISVGGVEVAEPVTGAVANTKNLTLGAITNGGGTAGKLADGDELYLAIVDSEGKTHLSPTVTMANPVTATLTVEEMTATYGTPLAASNESVMKDQFDKVVKTGDYTFALAGDTTTATTITAAANKPGVALTLGDGKVTVTTAATTAAGTYEIDIYNQGAGTINEDSVLVGTITLTVAPKALALTDLKWGNTAVLDGNPISLATGGTFAITTLDGEACTLAQQTAGTTGTAVNAGKYYVSALSATGFTATEGDASATADTNGAVWTITPTSGNYTGTATITVDNTGTTNSDTITFALVAP